MVHHCKRKGLLGGDDVRAVFCKKRKPDADARRGGADELETSAGAEGAGRPPLEGLRVLVVAAGGVSSQRAALLASIARGLGARACAVIPGGGSAAVAELAPGAGYGGAGLIIVGDVDKLPGRLAEIGLQEERAEMIIVKDAWLSACAEKKVRVDWKDFLHISCSAASPSSCRGGDGARAASAPCREIPVALPANRVRLGDVEVDAFGFGTMNLGAFLVPRPKP